MGGLTRTDERLDIATADLGRPTVGLFAFEEIGDLDHRDGVDARRVGRTAADPAKAPVSGLPGPPR